MKGRVPKVDSNASQGGQKGCMNCCHFRITDPERSSLNQKVISYRPGRKRYALHVLPEIDHPSVQPMRSG